MSNAGCLLLSRLPRLDAPSRDVPAVIETPKGRPNKYDYDDGGAAFRLLAVMPEGTTFPYDFGFPIHLGDNGNRRTSWSSWMSRTRPVRLDGALDHHRGQTT